MVREKNESKKKAIGLREFLEQERKKLEDSTIRFSWHVVEYTPGYNTGGYYDTDVPAKHVKVSPDFDNEEAAKEWLDQHEPDEGKSLYVQRMRLIRQVYTRWVAS